MIHTPPAHLIDAAAEYLRTACRGSANAQPKGLIAQHLGCTERQFELAVNALRDRRELVGSGANGYFWCTNEREIRQTRAWLTGRLQTQWRRARNFGRDAMKQASGQMEIWA